MKRLFSIIVIIIVFIFLLTACTQSQVSDNTEIRIEDEKPVIGGQLSIACVEPMNFNPVNIKNKSYLDITNLIFNGLFEYDKDLRIVPVLAKEISIDEETGKSIIKLRNDIFWSDGNKVTSNDVKFTLDMIKNNSNSIYKNSISRIMNYQIIDDETIKISFTKSYFNVLEQLCFPIIPKHIYTLNENSIPVGTGPYKVTNYKKLKHMDLEPNNFYWDKEKPYIAKIKVLFVDNAYAFDTFFQSREIDVLHASSYDWEKYKELKDINTLKYISDGFEFISINHKNNLLMDKAVRQALMYAINRRAIADKYLLGHAVLTDTPVKPGSWLDDGLGVKYNYSKAEAQYILNNAGFYYNNNSKVFEREIEGQKQILRFTLITNSENNYRVKAAEDIKKYLEEAGFVIDLKIIPFEDVKNAMENKKYDLVLTGVNMQQGLISFLYSSQITGEKNYGSYSNEDIDLLIDHIMTKQNNPNILINDYKKIQEIIREDLPLLSLFYKEYALVMRSKVRGVIEPDSVNLFRTIGKWYIVKDEAELNEQED